LKLGLRLRVLAACVAALLPVSVFADYVDISGPGVVVISTAPANETFALDFGTVCAGSSTSKTAALAIAARSHPDGTFFMFADGSTATLAVDSVTGSGLSATIAAPSSITLPSNWSSLPDGTLSSSRATTVTLNSSTLGAFNGTVVFSASGVQVSGAPITKWSKLEVTANVVQCGTPDVEVVKTAGKSQQRSARDARVG
jgi:hypothetical protein